MALFNLDIERYYQQVADEGFELKSIAYLQYPVYCIHATILDSTPEPLDKLDQAILKCIDLQKTISNHEISQLLCIQERAVKLRVRQLENEEFIQGGRNRVVSESGRQIMLLGEGKRLQRRSYDFYLDGIDLSPLKSEMYSSRYSRSFYSEIDYSYYTNRRGETRVSKPFKPNIVHEPIEKDKVIESLFNIDVNQRQQYSIPNGIESVESIDFTKMTMPILVSLLVKEGSYYRDLIDGFSSVGDSHNIETFYQKIEKKIQKLELRLSVSEDSAGVEKKFFFGSNWNEIDLETDGDRLQFISTEDLKVAFSCLYRINNLDSESIINDDSGIGLIISEELLSNMSSGKREILNHLLRGRDYTRPSYQSDIWTVFISFIPDGKVIKELVEILSFLKDARVRDLSFEDKVKRITQYGDFRKALVIIEEYDLLEQIDIEEHMYQIANEKLT